MIAVIFEVTPRLGQHEDYFRFAADLRHSLEKIDGFISVERFESLSRAGTFLSLSFWRDEQAVMCWRTSAEHRIAQTAGRHRIFDDYRLRVAQILRDYGMSDRTEAPADSGEVHLPL